MSFYTNWAVNEPDLLVPGSFIEDETSQTHCDTACGYIAANGQWYDGSCTTLRPFVCKQLTLGVSYSCACNGISDANGFGGYCNYWNGSSISWCWCP